MEAISAAMPATLRLNSSSASSSSALFSQFYRPQSLACWQHVKYPRKVRCRRLNLKKKAITAQSFNHSDFSESAYRVVEEARKKVSETADFVKSAINERNLKRSVRRAVDAANEWVGEMTFETKRAAGRFDRRFRVREKVEDGLEFVRDQAKRFDREFGVTQKTRTFSMDLRRNWPRYKRELDDFSRTPLGRAFSTLIFLWLLISGWLFRIIILGTWVLPFAAPLLLQTLARRTVIEGVCPSCKRSFIGNRNQTIRCTNCSAVVWQPRQDFSKGSSDPEIIDIDIEEK
eukprot:TRINITY_DN902_c0_g1_i1.p1 TRINITY_DN902_c0_g1~~TRINITY_DN902_c0_g1_i1.p1  ORF type:complete len:288 (-),score=38.45 TRINITY_DN902_c0_g1_i1:56-919(-)